MKRGVFLFTAFGIASLALRADCVRADEPLAIGGFGAASYGGDFDQRRPESRVDQVELDLTRAAGSSSSIRADLEYTAVGNEWVAAVEQAWLAYQPPTIGWLKLTAGRFNAPIGYESLDAPEMLQISHSLVFNFCTPANLTGLMATNDLGAGMDLKVYAADDWELNGENNGVPTFGGRLGRSGGTLSGGLSAISGMRDAAQSSRTTVFDVDVSATPTSSLSVGGELNYGQVAQGDTRHWSGVLAVAHWQWRPAVGFTGRFDWLDDPDELLVANGRTAERSSVTGAAAFTLGPGVRAMAELRRDQAVSDVYLDHDGKAKRSRLSGALNVVFSF